MSSKTVADALQKALADTFVLYFKTHSFHWNVTGASFKGLHDMFEEQYTDMWEAIDEIAERIRALGEYAPNNHSELMKIASLRESSQTPDADSMCEALSEDNQAITKTLYSAMKIAEEEGDEATADLMIERVQFHEKSAWMLSSSVSR